MKLGRVKGIGGFLAVVLAGLGIWAAATIDTPQSPEQAPDAQQAPIVQQVAPPAPRIDHVPLPAELADIPEEFTQRCEHEGSLQRFNYDTVTRDGEQRAMKKYAIVYLPYGYGENPEQRYDIVYLMHGMGGGAVEQLGTTDEPSMTKRMLDNLIDKGMMEPLIVVAVSYYPDNKVVDTPDWDASLTKSFGEELRQDLMPALEAQYRTYAEEATPEGFRASRAHRAFGGFSMGAVTTWYRLCDSLDYFKYFIPVSGSLLWGVEYTSFMADGGDKAAQYVVDAIRAQGFGPNDYFVFTATGSLDEGLAVIAPQLEGLAAYPEFFVADDTDNKANLVYLVAEGEEHDYHGYARALYTALPHVTAMMQAGA